MDKTLKALESIANKTITREYMSVTDNFKEVVKKNKEWAREYEECSDKADEIAEKLRAVVPEQYRGLIDELVDNTVCSACAEEKMLFKEGIILGCTELSYLGEIGTHLQFI